MKNGGRDRNGTELQDFALWSHSKYRRRPSDGSVQPQHGAAHANPLSPGRNRQEGELGNRPSWLEDLQLNLKDSGDGGRRRRRVSTVGEWATMTRHGRCIALAKNVAQKSNCIRRSVGAVIIRNDEILATGWNGVSESYDDCRSEGCPRCINRGIASVEYHECICRHAEQSAIADAAARGVNTHGSHLYVTRRPCFQCLAVCRAAGVSGIFFEEAWTYPEELERKYLARAAEFDSFECLRGVLSDRGTDLESGEPHQSPDPI